MKKLKASQRRHLLTLKVLKLYQKHYLLFIKPFNFQFKKEPEYSLDTSMLIENSTRIKQKRMILKYSRITYIHKQFEESLNHLSILLIKKRENKNKRMLEAIACVRASNDVLRKKMKQEPMNLCDLDAQKIVAAYQIYNILNEE